MFVRIESNRVLGSGAQVWIDGRHSPYMQWRTIQEHFDRQTKHMVSEPAPQLIGVQRFGGNAPLRTPGERV